MNEPLLAVDDIQGNIAPGFGKPVQLFLFLRWTEPASGHALLGELVPHVTSMRTVYRRRKWRKAHLAATEAVPSTDDCWINVALNSEALASLGDDEISRLDEAFSFGMARRSAGLGDPRNSALPGHKSNWVVGGPQNEAHVVVIAAADSDGALRPAREWLHSLIERLPAVHLIHEDIGHTLPGDKEHFGFRDDISQPGVRGLVSTDPPETLTTRHMDTQPPHGPELARPGQPLIWPGQFILGYPTQSQVSLTEPVAPSSDLPMSALNGSFLVIRRLIQDVQGFHATTRDEATRLAQEKGWEDLDGPRLRSMLVGRWPSGAPVMRSPDADDSDLARERFAINHFGFAEDTPDVQLTTGEVIPGVSSDPKGFVCPHAAHIRKVNPRDADTDRGPAAVTLTLRVLRRGIPFGPAYDHERPEAPENSHERGLIFASYQASIGQFEILNSKWMNSSEKPESPQSLDLLVGQQTDAAGGRTRTCRLSRSAAVQGTITSLRDWVIPTGGGYFFAPSISMLRALAMAPSG